MSSRLYPLYQAGNPQLRVFLPNVWMKMVNPGYREDKAPKNRLKFIVSNEMSRLDVKNYLLKIYQVPVASVKIHVEQGKTRQALKKQYIVKDDDFKVAYVTLPKGVSFEFPDIFPEDKRDKDLEDEKKQIEQMQQTRDKFLAQRKTSINKVPGWFS